MDAKPRQYVRHRWLYQNNKAVCFVCGITEAVWNKKIENDSMLNWDCHAMQHKKPK
jgi:hypothetical protein